MFIQHYLQRYPSTYKLVSIEHSICEMRFEVIEQAFLSLKKKLIICSNFIYLICSFVTVQCTYCVDRLPLISSHGYIIQISTNNKWDIIHGINEKDSF